MKKTGMPAVRLTLAGRVLQHLNMLDRAKEIAAVCEYIKSHHARFGLTRDDCRRDPKTYEFGDHLIGLAGALPHTGFENQIKVRLSSYMATLLGTDSHRTNIILHLTLAALDQTVRDLATVATFGIPSDPRIHAIPMVGLKLLMEGEDAEVSRPHPLMVGDMYLGTRVIEAVHLTESRNHKSGQRTLSEHPVCKIEGDDYPANGLKLDDEIVMALRGRWTEVENLSPGCHDAEAEPLQDLALIAPTGPQGIQIAYRSHEPADTAIAVAEKIQAAGHDVAVIHEVEENSVLVALIAAQAYACLQKTRNRAIPVCVVPDTWSLVGAAVYHSVEPSLMPTGVAEQAVQYDTDRMTYQKDLLRIIGGEILSPIVWILDRGVPISSGLVGMFSQISDAPRIDLTYRAKAISEVATINGITLDQPTALRIAAYTPYPEELAGAFRGLSRSGRFDDVEEVCKDVLRNSGLDRPVPQTVKRDFNLRLVEAHITLVDPVTGEIVRDNTLERAIDLFVQKRDRPIKLLLHGDPGTSKTEVSHYIASRLGMDVIEVKPSSIFDRWVGSSENKIRELFEKAAEGRKFILIDECDTFLSARGENQASYEKSGTNEWLIQMQKHQLPMACTTNHLARIDPAAVRRFLFKIEVKPLNTDRARIAWTELLNLPISECPEAEDLHGLTVNDFALVRERMHVLDITSARFARQSLLEEKSTREAQSSRRIGFLP